MLPTRNVRFLVRVKLGLSQRHCASVVEPLEAVSDQSTDVPIPVFVRFCFSFTAVTRKFS